MTPQELVTAAQNGNHDAFAQLWHMYRDDIMRLAYRRTSDRWLSEDITSETFLRAWRRLPQFTWRDKGFGGWLATIASNLIIDHYKSSHQRHTAYHPLDTSDDKWSPPVSTDQRTDPEAAVEQSDLAVHLDEAIRQLTPDQRRVLALKFGAGLGGVETARLMHRRTTAVKALQWRAIQSLAADPDLAAAVTAA